MEVCFAEIRITEIRIAEIRRAEVCMTEVRPAEVRPAEVRPAKVCMTEIDIAASPARPGVRNDVAGGCPAPLEKYLAVGTLYPPHYCGSS